jgi:hypothetical protein
MLAMERAVLALPVAPDYILIVSYGRWPRNAPSYEAAAVRRRA